MSAPEARSDSPDFRHIRNWIFDLDNTLYPSSCDLFGQIDEKMALYTQRLLGITLAEARKLQKEYYHAHGTTLNGLMRVNGVDAEDYLAYVHDIDLSVLTPEPALQDALAKLPGRKFIFTNGCTNHAGRVLDRLGIAGHFDDVWDIRTIGFQPKPDAAAYRTVLAHAGSDGRDAAMFEDITRNLVEAKELGMTTVWLKNGSDWSRQGPSQPVAQPHHIDYETDDLAAFLQSIRVSP
ncbi:MAG TPA: pyrimidine 5'-nucleotidase [Rhizomicrobium sp.]|jgi:putative hydrolase of the HAD superfamily